MRKLVAVGTSLVFIGCGQGTSGTPSDTSSTADDPAVVASAAATSSQGALVTLAGVDTVGVERFTRGVDRLQSEFSAKGVVTFRFDAALAADATVSRIEIVSGSGGGSVGTATFRSDSVLLTQGTGDSLKTMARAAVRGAVPYLNPSAVLMEQIVRRAHVLGGETATVPVFMAGNAEPDLIATVTFITPDSVRLDLAGTTAHFRVQPGGGVVRGSIPAQGFTIVRVVGG